MRPTTKTKPRDVLWYWVSEREKIRQRKENNIITLTSDQILMKYRFCNVRREDDRVTRWIRDNIRGRWSMHSDLWLMLCIARQINWPPTLQALIDTPRAWPNDPYFSPKEFARILRVRDKGGEKVFTGAYIITAGPIKGEPKADYLARETIGKLWEDRDQFRQLFRDHPTLQLAHTQLMRYAGWGPFLAYQAVVDMRFTHLLRNAADKLSWAAAGPGTIRGLNRLHKRPLEYRLSQQDALLEIRELYHNNPTGIEFDFSDVPNILCEFDKYMRVLHKQGKPKAYYTPETRF